LLPLLNAADRTVNLENANRKGGMRRFKWIEWNLDKIAAHGLSQAEVEAAFELAYDYRKRRDGSIEMLAETPAGRRITIVWRHDQKSDSIPDIFGEIADPPIFVITAY
jgi:hypothetical protein